MGNPRRFFMSDVHLGGPKAWFKPDQHKANMLACLRWITKEAADLKNVKDLVLLGDLFDTWMFPMDEPPLELDAIANLHPEIIAAIRGCSEVLNSIGGNVFYVNGNHDMHVTQAELDRVFHPGVVRWIPRYQGGLLYAEHGSRFAMFNAPDYLHDTASGLPVGYFVTRMLASGNNTYDSPRAIYGYVDEILKAIFTTETVAECLVEAIMEVAGRKPDDVFKMAGGRRDLTIADVRTKYAKLYQKWNSKFGPQYTLNAIRADVGSLGWFADELCRSQGFKVVVLGHTHDEELDKESLFLKGSRGYANSGYWCCAAPSLVEVEKNPKCFMVRLHDWRNGEKAKPREMEVPVR